MKKALKPFRTCLKSIRLSSNYLLLEINFSTKNSELFFSEHFSAAGRAITAFNQSPLMPTYLVAFVICDFEVNSKLSASNILFRVFARPEQLPNTEFGLETGERALELFEGAFETKYELNKLDQVALPVFNRGGMENYGIVFYREDYLLFEPSVSVHIYAHKLFYAFLADRALIRVYRFVISRAPFEGYHSIRQRVRSCHDCS